MSHIDLHDRRRRVSRLRLAQLIAERRANQRLYAVVTAEPKQAAAR